MGGDVTVVRGKQSMDLQEVLKKSVSVRPIRLVRDVCLSCNGIVKCLREGCSCGESVDVAGLLAEGERLVDVAHSLRGKAKEKVMTVDSLLARSEGIVSVTKQLRLSAESKLVQVKKERVQSKVKATIHDILTGKKRWGQFF